MKGVLFDFKVILTCVYISDANVYSNMHLLICSPPYSLYLSFGVNKPVENMPSVM